MGHLFLPELDQYAQRDPLLYEILRKIVERVNRIPLISGRGNPEGQVAARPGTLYLCEDPLLGDVAYIKASGNEETGWGPVLTSRSGLTRATRSVSGSTSSGSFTTVASIQVVVPPNTRNFDFSLALTGDGAARLKIASVVSNQITSSGTATLTNPPVGLQTLEVQAKANSGSVTATLALIESTVLAGDQMAGARADTTSPAPGTGGRAKEGPPKIERPRFGREYY